MKAPPRRSLAPEALTAWATWRICSRLSTEQGPAINWKLPPPIRMSSRMVTTVSSGWNFRLALLKGSEIRLTDSTMSSASRSSVSILVVSPTSPRTVWYLPREMWISRPCCSNQPVRLSICCCVVPALSTAIIIVTSV